MYKAHNIWWSTYSPFNRGCIQYW